MGVITRIKANISSTELGLTRQLELSLAMNCIGNIKKISWFILIENMLLLWDDVQGYYPSRIILWGDDSILLTLFLMGGHHIVPN